MTRVASFMYWSTASLALAKVTSAALRRPCDIASVENLGSISHSFCPGPPAIGRVIHQSGEVDKGGTPFRSSPRKRGPGEPGQSLDALAFARMSGRDRGFSRKREKGRGRFRTAWRR